jgi:hypothetical protein
LPHHHRVHHGCNPEYINCNFGGILIVFDRLFGTYREKLPHVPVVYGVKDPPEEKFWAVSFYGWKELWQDIRREHSLRQVVSGSRNSQLKMRDEHSTPTAQAFYENESFVLAGKTDLS